VPCIDLVLRGDRGGGTEDSGTRSRADVPTMPNSEAECPGEPPVDRCDSGGADGTHAGEDCAATGSEEPIVGVIMVPMSVGKC
jgi:hypothetical protein